MGKREGRDRSRRGSISENRSFGAGSGRYFLMAGVILSLWDLAGHLHSQGLGGPGPGSQQDLQCVGRAGPPSLLLQPCTQPGTRPGWHWPQTWLKEASTRKGESFSPRVWVHLLERPLWSPQEESRTPNHWSFKFNSSLPGSLRCPHPRGMCQLHICVHSLAQAWQRAGIRKCLWNE